MKKVRITESQLRGLVRRMIKEERYPNMWYDNLLGVENLNKYPQDFIDWLNQEDTWAETYVQKYRIKKLIDLFDMWVNERY